MKHIINCASVLALLVGCAAKPPVDHNQPVSVLYHNGVVFLQSGRLSDASEQFIALEENYPYSSLISNTELLLAYTQYRQENFTEALSQLDDFIKLHPVSKNISYARYLRALCYYYQMGDSKRDQRLTLLAIEAFEDVIRHHSKSNYAEDAKTKIGICRDVLAGKEMYIGRFYQKQHLYTAAVGRFQRVVDNFPTTNYIPEALHRLTEVYLSLGLKTQAQKTAAVLGYNYPGSSWYQESYNQLIADGVGTIGPDAFKPKLKGEINDFKGP